MEDKKIFITLISNILYEPYLQMYLKDAFSLAGRSIEINFLCYAEYKQNPKGVTASDIVVISLNFEELYPDAENIISVQNILEDFLNTVGGQCRELYNYVRKMTYCSVLWLGFEDYYCNSEKWLGAILPLEGLIDEINRKVYQMVTPQDIFIDMKRLIAEIGIRCAYDEKSKYRWNAPYSKILVKRISEEIYAQYLIQMARTRKCLVLDCDNVLWGGVLAEDGVDGIKVGQSGSGRSYQDFQRVLLNLYYHGVILTVCSKNEEQDVLRVFREHSGMVLKEEQIACFQINWDNKPDNIRKISEELSLGLDSMVFVDDSLFEVEAVREILPEVKSILYDRKKIYKEFSCFKLKSQVSLQQIKQRNFTYQTNVQRMKVKSMALSFEAYLKSLEMKIDIHEAFQSELSRLAELTQRTNKCTNGVRYSFEELRKIWEGGISIYSVSITDKFSNLGIVGILVICDKRLEAFALSCRALGRGVEEQMMKYCKNNGVLTYRFNETRKNIELDKRLSSCFRRDA